MRIRRLGARAAGLIAAESFLEVMAVFEHSFYASGSGWRFVCFLREDSEPGPLHALCSDWPADCRSIIRVGDRLGRVPGGWSAVGLHICAAGTEIWRPRPFPDVSPGGLAAGLAGLAALLPDLSPPDCPLNELWLKRIAGNRLAPAPCSPRAAAWRDRLAGEIIKGLSALTAWLLEPEPEPPPEELFSLIGLGFGLTPTGDDVLAGAFLAIRALGRGDLIDLAMPSLRERLANRQTHEISAAHLLAAADGEAAAVLHDVLAGLAGDDNLAEVLPRLSRMGGGSGWDALLGMAWAISDLTDDYPAGTI